MFMRIFPLMVRAVTGLLTGRTEEMEAYSSYVYVACEKYSNAAFHIRDRMMVDNSDIVLSLLIPDAVRSGTAVTVRYAEKHGKQIIPFWEPEDGV